MLSQRLGNDWVALNISLLLLSIFLCFTGYSFIFSVMRSNKTHGLARTEQFWGLSLGVADIAAATITVPVFISGLVLQEDFLPSWGCHVTGFIDNLYLAASVWSIVMWSVCRYIFIRHPLNQHHVQITKLLILVVWCCAAVFALLPDLLSMPYRFSGYSLTCSSNNTHYNLALGLLTIAIPLLVIIVVFSLTFHITLRMDRPRSRRVPFARMFGELPAPYIPHVPTTPQTPTHGVADSSKTPHHSCGFSSGRNVEGWSQGERRYRKFWSHASTIIEEIGSQNTDSNQRYARKSAKDKDSQRMYVSSSEETVFSDMISPASCKTPHFRWTPLTPVQWSRLRIGSIGKETTARKRALSGSRRTLAVLSCLFVTQVMSLLPVFLAFVLVHFGGSVSWIPSHRMVVLSTTLMVSNTGLNPVIRIIIKPAYNAIFLARINNLWSRLRDLVGQEHFQRL